MSGINEILRKSTEILQASGIVEPRREAASLLAVAVDKNQTFLIAHSEYELSAQQEKRFWEFVRRRASREPFQYITGRQEFYGLEFEVAPGVLIPRPETELIVENAIEISRSKQNALICEVGVGSGCISVAILHEIKTARVIGLDLSRKALEIARRNAAAHQISERIELKFSDVFGVLKNEKFDIIVSNPPYVSSLDIAGLQPEVRGFEPLTALTDGADGLSIIKKIIDEAPAFLKPDGLLLLEIGFNQAGEVRALFAARRQIWQSPVEILPDLQGIPRMVKARITQND